MKISSMVHMFKYQTMKFQLLRTIAYIQPLIWEVFAGRLVYATFKTTYRVERSPGENGEKSVGTSVCFLQIAYFPNPGFSVHIQPLEQAYAPLLCQSTEDTMNGQTISHVIFYQVRLQYSTNKIAKLTMCKT
jgi:hypothetical protein